MANRRTFLKTAASAGAAGSMLAAPAPTSPATNIYARLGVRPCINGVGVVTHLGGSLMPPEVVSAMEEASKYFVPLTDLQRKVGARIAELLGAEAAMVTCGCASAITMGTAACVARGIPENLKRLPDTTGMKNEIVQQKTHRGGYEQQMWLVGTKTVWVETREELDKAINERTAMMFFYNEMEPEGKIGRHEWIRVGKERGVPTFNDAASDTPPPERLSQYIREGFDLVAFSGGKALRGPQCSGLLMGRKELIEAALPAFNPYASIGRGMKVGKEEMVGLLAAIERYLKVDHAQELKELEGRVADMMGVLKDVKGVQLERHMPPIANHVPHLRITWNEDAYRFRAGEVTRQLMEGEPSIAISARGERLLQVSVWMMRPGENMIVARRLKEVFQGAA
ncbi:MAG: twin-arginine translocation signal domain-containing protein [Bryobacterales bacterium]|nr:twin-arginine translocation signal domain-containing protein [Bryobacterales bacterium]MCZ2152011.1 twin-arginine translocation signal domain-containing protein [Bryobacterales bacterium]